VRAPNHIDQANYRSICADDIRIIGANIVLESSGGGSSITINKAGIEITSVGNVTVNGAVVMLNCD
jgi:uncharacterized protein (DUF2345 family)